MERFEDSISINTTMSKSDYIVIDERVDKYGEPFVVLINFYLQSHLFCNNIAEALLHLCDLTCNETKHPTKFLNDVELLLHSFYPSKSIDWRLK